MDLTKLSRAEWAGLAASALLVLAVLFMPWYSLAENPTRDMGEGFVCGVDDYSCTGFETFPILRWLLLLGALAPWILAYIIVRGHHLSWPRGEMTMIVGFTAFVLVFYNGLIDIPGSNAEEIGVSEDYGYWVALLASAGIALAGLWRSIEEQGTRPRKPPGTV